MKTSDPSCPLADVGDPSPPMDTHRAEALADLARSLASRLGALVECAVEREGCDLVHVSTEELCRALGKPDGATMEEVKELVRLLLQHLSGRGVAAACGCGLLSLQVGQAGFMDRAVAEERELIVFTPEDIEQYLGDR
jgi:hypothetical protein